MCGICLMISPKGASDAYHKQFNSNTCHKTKHRGPDETVQTQFAFDNGRAHLTFHRLSIIDTSSAGSQPIINSNRMLMCNGEIYNYKDLDAEIGIKHSGSDCYSIMEHYMHKRSFDDTIRKLDGDFAILLIDYPYLYVARDPIGVRPLFYSISDTIQFASEAKSIIGPAMQFPAGSIGKINLDDFCRDPSPERLFIDKYWTLNNIEQHSKVSYEMAKQTIQNMLISAVKKRLMSDRPIGFLLSGGLDSSIVASIAKHIDPNMQLNTFAIGIKGSPDLKYARIMADHLKSNHTEVYFTAEEGINAIDEVINYFETFDCTTIRAGTPMYLLSKYISKNTDIKVILSGEGSDELFGGYLYFHNAPSTEDFHAETLNLIERLPQYDVLRADRATASCGLELRVPFLDRQFIKFVTSIDPEYKRCNKSTIEKKILREAFNDMMPHEIAWRQKEAFSDGVGYSWISELKKRADDGSFNLDSAIKEFPHVPPQTAEEYMYRKIYTKYFPDPSSAKHIKKMWRVNWKDQIDPSATFLDVHESSS